MDHTSIPRDSTNAKCRIIGGAKSGIRLSGCALPGLAKILLLFHFVPFCSRSLFSYRCCYTFRGCFNPTERNAVKSWPPDLSYNKLEFVFFLQWHPIGKDYIGGRTERKGSSMEFSSSSLYKGTNYFMLRVIMVTLE